MYFAGFRAVVKCRDNPAPLEHSEAQTLLGVFGKSLDEINAFSLLFSFSSSLMASNTFSLSLP